MRFSVDFLKEFIDLTMPIPRLVEILTMAGMEVETIQQLDSDWVLDIEITTNRYDWLSVLGVAREIAACACAKFSLIIPENKTIPLITDRKIIIENPQDCPWYTGRMFKNVSITSSPEWLLRRINHCGINSVSNVVDITNYCMLKWGNPLHAFDLDAIEGDIFIRRAKKGEILIGIDEKTRVLTSENLVIADEKKVIALAGVMGAKNTEVTAVTKNIFLEGAIFSPYTVRMSRRAAGIDTDSSYRFERMVGSDTLEYACAETGELITKIALGEFTGYVQSGQKPRRDAATIDIDIAEVNKFLGTDISIDQVQEIVNRLNCAAAIKDDTIISIVPSLFRCDLNEPVDIYEEIARIYGFERIPAVLPFLRGDLPKDTVYELKKNLRLFLVSLGLREIVTYSIEEDNELKNLGFGNCIHLKNPLREQENVMRPNLLIGALKTARHNLNRGQENLKFFEFANIYNFEKNQIVETQALSLCAVQEIENLYYLKHVIKQIGHWCGLTMELNENSLPNFTNALKIVADGIEAGFIGKLDACRAKEFNLKTNIYFAQINVQILSGLRKTYQYRDFSPYPAVYRDVSIVIAANIKFSCIETTAAALAGNYLQDLKIIDEYKGKDIAQGCRAITMRLFYQAQERTLTNQEVDQLHTVLREKLSSLPGVVLR